MVSKRRYESAYKRGRESERKFVEACENVGYVARKSSKEDDIYKHIDFYIHRTNGTVSSVDVKGGNFPNSIWVEFKNVHGNTGWMYGEAEYIAFEMKEVDGFCMINRLDLLSYCKKNVEPTFVDISNSYKKLYQRKDRKDVLTKIWLTDLESCDSYKILKYNKNE